MRRRRAFFVFSRPQEIPAMDSIAGEINRILRTLVAEWERITQRDIDAFGAALDAWLQRVVPQMPSDAWRDELQQFLAAWQARGVTVEEDSAAIWSNGLPSGTSTWLSSGQPTRPRKLAAPRSKPGLATNAPSTTSSTA
jgi:hypothetical protein